MANSLAPIGAPRHRVIPETRPRMAKADLRKTEMRAKVGLAVQRAMALRGWTLDEFSAAVGRDARQVRRWTTGEERAQIDTILDVESLRKPMIQALGEIAGAAVEVIVRIA